MRKIGLLGTSALGSTALLGMAVAFAAPAHAQAVPNVPPAGQTAGTDPEEDTAAEGGSQGENTITVTGSRIARPEVSGVLPGVQVDQEQIETRGFTNAIEVINDIPLTGTGASLSGTNGIGQPTGLGLAFVDLLDLGTTRTLTLVNGRRFVGGNSATLFAFGNETGGQVDINTIPTLLINRVDVVTVGGAAAYGTDAISGVVNFILRDNYEGTDISAISNISERGDGFGYNLRAIHGMNFAGDRGNIVINGEYSRIDSIAGGREFLSDAPFFVGAFNNGGIRNPAFTPVIGGTTSPFLPSASDLAPGFLSINFSRSLVASLGGSVFEVLATIPARNGVAASPGAQSFISPTATQFIPGTTVSAAQAGCGLANTRFCNFAPSALPGTGADQDAFAQAVLAALSPSNVAAGTQAQRNTLALQLLQANRPTPREFFAANPGVPTGAFIGQFVTGFIDVANPNTTPVTIAGQTVPLNQILPRVGVPLQFDAAGNVIPIDPGTLTPTTPATLQNNTSPGGFFDIRGAGAAGTVNAANLVRPQQDRYLANLIAKFDITENITFFTENLYARVNAILPRVIATGNTVAATAPETAALILNVNNPFLDATDRAALATYGITPAVRNGNFVLSRINQDIIGENPSGNRTETYRSVVGFRGDFGLLNQRHNWELSGTYGRSDLVNTAASLLDVEFALAVDAVDEGLFRTGVANGVIRCRAQLDPTAATNLAGIQPNIIRETGPDGIQREVVFTPTASAAQIAACQPLNPFGFNQASQAAKDYVRASQRTDNRNEQIYLQALLSGGLFDLPGGTLQYALSGEYRQDELGITQDEVQLRGRTRNAPTSPTVGKLKTIEAGAELRIPIFGEDFNIPLFHSLEFNPSVRFTKQTGSSTTFRNLAGTVINPRYEGDFETIYSLAGTWQPVRDITIRGNYTRSLRQPNIVELFLTNQSAFAQTNDPCSNQRINSAPDPARRRANCTALVVSSGVRNNTADATTFLNSFVSNDISQAVAFAGNTGLRPEKGESYTVGAILRPRFLPRLSLSADYINLTLRDQITPTNPTQAAGFCVDSPTFPDTTPSFGTNLCAFIPRSSTTFQVQPGAAGQYLNLSSTKVEGINISGLFSFDLSPGNRLTLRSNAFHLMRHDQSATGLFNDSIRSVGSFTRPEWEAVSSVRLDSGIYFGQLTHRYQDETTIFSGGAPVTIEFAQFFRYPEQHLFDLSLGVDLESGFRAQFVVTNLTDKTVAGQTGRFNQVYFDQIGRRFQVQVGYKF
jgi:outer membrane receptor protein involved in Fe transport